MGGKFKDLIGQKFGRWTVIEQVDPVNDNDGRVRRRWLCQCDCGKIHIVKESSLKQGLSKSCGCARKETLRKKSINLTGQRFGKLLVIERTENKINVDGSTLCQWLCKCDCGNIVKVKTAALRNGNTKSCGCLQKEKASKINSKDLTGQKFGKLTVIEKSENHITISGHHQSMWLCKCDCGNFKIVRGSDLHSGQTNSCGCMISSGEYYLITYLMSNNIKYEYQKRFDDCRGIGDKPLSYDFYLPYYNLLIEYQGMQHYEPVILFGGEEQFEIQQEHDRRKREYAKSNGYNLLEIPYYDYDNIQEILDKALSTSKVGNS